jgi:hypothetical protein
MANPLKGEAALRLADGRELMLVLDFEALIAAEAAYAKPLHQLMADSSAGFMGATRALLWGAMQGRQGGLSLADAGALLLSDHAAVLAALGAAGEAAMPAAEGDKAGNAARRRGGTRSGSNGAKPGSTRRSSGARPRAASS